MEHPKPRLNARLTPVQAEALEARFALRLSARLNEGNQAFSHDISERLRVARMQAVTAARAAASVKASQKSPQTAPQLGLALAGASGSSSAGGHAWLAGQQRDHSHGRRMDDGPTAWGWRLASALPIIALVVGLWAISHWYQGEQVRAAATVDLALLTDELPPAAYIDPGFEEFLKTTLSAQVQEDTPGVPADQDAPAPVESLENRDPVKS